MTLSVIQKRVLALAIQEQGDADQIRLAAAMGGRGGPVLQVGAHEEILAAGRTAEDAVVALVGTGFIRLAGIQGGGDRRFALTPDGRRAAEGLRATTSESRKGER